MSEKLKLSLKQMHPGVADMDSVYEFYCEYDGKAFYDNTQCPMFMLSTDCEDVTIHGLDVIVPYSFRQARRTVQIKAVMNDYINKVTDTAYYDLSFATTFIEEPTFFDDFETYDESKWKAGSEGWEYGETPKPYIDGSDIVLTSTKEHPLLIISTAHSFQQTYGCFSAKLKMPERKNSACQCNMAFWLCSNVFEPEKIMFKRNPQVEEPFGRNHAGEIDIVEYSCAFGDYSAMSYHHYGWGQYSRHNGYCAHTPGVRDGYHIFSLVWEPDAIYWYFDGRLSRVINNDSIKDAGKEPGGDMVMLLDSASFTLENREYKGNWVGMHDPKDYPLEFRADWVKAHALKID